MSDDTEQARRDMIETGQPTADLAAEQGQTWDTAELQRDFDVIGYAAPFVVVKRSSDGQRGSLEFTASPRVYFGFTEHRGWRSRREHRGRLVDVWYKPLRRRSRRSR